MKKLGKITKGDVYAVHTGTYAGEMLVYVGEKSVDMLFLAIPTMLNRYIPKVSFEHARNTDIIKYVEKLPKDIIKVVEAQFHKNEDTNNRHEQFNSQNILDCKETGKF